MLQIGVDDAEELAVGMLPTVNNRASQTTLVLSREKPNAGVRRGG